MGQREEVLLRELLENAQISGGQVLERRLADTAVWYYKNVGSIPKDNLAAKQAFLEKAMWIMVEINALAVARIHELESSRGGGLWLPKGLSFEGDIKKYG